MILEPPRLTSTTGMHGYAWQTCGVTFAHATIATQALNSLHARRGGGEFMRLRAQVGSHEPPGEAAVGQLLGC